MAKARIMVVEDEFILAQGITAHLLAMDYSVTSHVTSGEAAIKQVEKDLPDLILMDIVMPGKLDGIEAAEQIRKKLSVPIVFLTAYSDDETIERAKSAEPFGYLLKPFTERELYIAIEMALSKDKAEKDPRRSWKRTPSMQDFDPDLL
ncbi:MAG: response regulator [Thermodesulfobacteriota bacterium]